MSEDERKAFFAWFGIVYAGAATSAMIALMNVVGKSGAASQGLTFLVAQALAKSFVGRSLTMTTTSPVLTGMAPFLGPVGWALTGIWTAFDLASPAYRLTVPCVVQVAYMRQKLSESQCNSCK